MHIYTPPSDSQAESPKMKLLYFSNEFPHDDLHEIFRRLRNHSKDRQHPFLARFIDEATAAVRDEIRSLPVSLKALLPHFDTVLNLADHPDLRKGPLCGSIEGVLLCVVELAALIGYYEKHPDQFGLSGANTCLAGLGIGLLATAAVSVSQTLADFPLAGADVVRAAFRLGVLVDEVSENLEPRELTGPPASWASVVPDVAAESVQAELDAIHAKEETPDSSKVFLSAVNQTSVTVSGPPSRLKHVFQISDIFRGRKVVQLPVYGGLCHAKHIYNQEHVHEVVGQKLAESLEKKPSPTIPIFSTSSGRPYIATSARDLFDQIISELLTQRIEWDNVVQGIIEHANTIAASECQAFVFRISLPAQTLLDSLNSNLEHFETSTEEIIPWINKEVTDEATPSGTHKAKIAIVGMSCRMPGGATDTEKFWDLLEQGLDVHRKIPADRFDVDTHYDPTGKRVNTSHTPYGCFIDEPGLFDAPFFNMSPREAQQTDPMQRLALVTAYEALERAGYVANRTAATNLHRIGTFYGQASDDYREVNTAQEISTYFIPGGCRAFGPGRINYFFKFSGPSFSCDTACSSSLATIQAACTSLWNGETDTVVAGGMNVLTNSDAFAGLSNGHFLSKTPNACKTWDCEADGYCRADGIGSIVMKRLEDAEADNDNILGVILGAATNHSAEAVSITHPHAGAQSYLTRQVLSSAGIDPLDVSFVEMHGTGTQAGDGVEIKSVTDVFAPTTKRRTSKQPLYIGAVKANVGHGEAVAGVTALLKVLLMYQKGVIPPHVGIKNSLTPGFPTDLDKRNLHIPYQAQPWRCPDGIKKRLAVVNNFSAAGGNTTVLLEEPPTREIEAADPRASHVVAVSAKSKVSLKGNLENLLAYLDARPDTSLANLSYSTTARRYHHNHRVAVSVSDSAQLKKKLMSYLDSVNSHQPIPTTGPPQIAFAFTGQGSSHKSMNLELFHESPYFKSQILHLDTLAQNQGFPSFVPAVDGSHPKDYVHSPVITQLALCAVEIALTKYWASLGVKPNVVVGHSLGEYAALHVAGVLSASDALFLVGRRAMLLEEKCQAGSHKMMAVRASLSDIESSAEGLPFEVACINGPKETVLSGSRDQIDAVAKPLQASGYRCYSLDVAFAFHSAQTDPILEEFEEIAKNAVVFRPSNLPIISPLLSKVIFDDKTVNANYVRRATREPVNFLAALKKAEEISTIDKDTAWIEIGPHPVCTSFVNATVSATNVSVPSLSRREDNWTTMTQSLSALHCAGVPIAWNEFHRPFEKSLRLLDLPTYAWNNKNYWIMYNGDWALTKGNTFYDAEKGINRNQVAPVAAMTSSLRTSTVQQIIEETFNGSAGKVVMQSDLMQLDFLAAANGHKMNGCGVVTSSIHADIAYTLGEYLYKKLVPGAKAVDIDIANLEVVKGLVAQKNTSAPQLIQVSVSTEDIHSGVANLEWHNVKPDGSLDDPFASAAIYYGNATEWLKSWIPHTHLVQGRMEALEGLADEGTANRFSHNMAYLLFANNLVDYADKYRGMQSVILHELEAVADVQLTTQKGGTWTVPPYFIDSVAHLAGFVMNVSDAIDTKENYCVTPGWRSMRFAHPLVAGAKYRSYVKMIPTAEDPTVYLGDVYIFHDNAIIGMVGGIQFRRYPRILLNRFFSAPDAGAAKSHTTTAAAPSTKPAPTVAKSAPTAAQVVAPVKPSPTTSSSVPAAPVVAAAAEPSPAPAAAADAPNDTDAAGSGDTDSVAAKGIALIARESAIEISELRDEAAFADLGVDSLMSLVISEKFRDELGITVSGSLFLEYPTVGDFRSWLLEYYN